MKKIFISYAREDFLIAQKIYSDLKKEGLNPWMDKPPNPYELDGLLPGEFWKDRLTKEIKESQFLIALLSNNSITKRGYVQREFKLALDIMNELPNGEEFLIPLLLDQCKVPDLKVGFVSLSELNWHDLETGGLTPIILKVKRNLNEFQQQLLSSLKVERKPFVGIKTRLIDLDETSLKENTNDKIKWRNFIGKQKWKNNPKPYDSQIIVGSAGKVWNTGDEFDGIYSIDEQNGNILWKVDSLSDANEITVYQDIIYVGTDGGEIFSIMAKTGDVNWCKIYDGEFHTEIKIVIQENKQIHDILAFDFFGNILLIDSKTGEVLDSVRIKDNFRSSSINLNNNFLIVISQKV
ncbi:MAG: TIR domain-containing protein [Saprospiraceae bacterium]|nr:TIR domain-containing protein [Saprospiraceae bacterium]